MIIYNFLLLLVFQQKLLIFCTYPLNALKQIRVLYLDFYRLLYYTMLESDYRNEERRLL
jgi:hypothetical protein